MRFKLNATVSNTNNIQVTATAIPGGALKVLRLYVVEARWSNYKFEVLVFSTDVICCHIHDW